MERPIYVDQAGIDPSLLFDDDGKVYFLSNGNGDMSICEIDIRTGKKLAPTRSTRRGHRRTLSRSAASLQDRRDVLHDDRGRRNRIRPHGDDCKKCVAHGPWEPSPRNPILTNRNTEADMPIQATGHADLVQTQNGDWYAVFLAFRTSQQYFHHLGRETYLAPVQWEDGFPYIGTCPLEGDVNLPECPVAAHSPVTDFHSQGLEWVMLREPNAELYQFTDHGLLPRVWRKTSTPLIPPC